MDREIRNLLQTKQKKVIAATGIPSNTEGSNNDIRISRTSDGVELFIKYNNEWYKTTLTKIGG